MTYRSYKSGLLGLTAAAALFAVPSLAQTQTQPRDGTPGNPPSTAAQRAADAATGNRTPADGTPGNPPGTALGRAAERATEGASGANQRAGDPANTNNQPDGTPGNPPGTAVSRGVDRALGTNISGAFPQNEGSATDGTRASTTGRSPAADRENEPAAANANPGAMGSNQAVNRGASGAQGPGQTQPGAVNATPDGGQARAGTTSVPLQNQAAGNAPANPNGPGSMPAAGATAGAAAGGAAATASGGTAATAPMAQTDRASRIIGSSVYNERNEAIGSVDDLILASGGSSPMAIVSVGGFLGIGAKLVAVPMSDLRWSAADNRWTITGATRESLTSLPAYSYDAARRG
ncbi:PRC-barrel domain-containing protein [Roseomonas sp. GCM10028921]